MPSKPKATIERYGRLWPADIPEPLLEIRMIQKGEECATREGRTLFQHYKRLQELLWPEDYFHKWCELMLREILQNRITAIIGPKDSGKTYFALAKFGLTDYFCFPTTTLIMLSSTDVRGLELRVFGALKDLFERAKNRYPDLPGYLVDSRHAICTDDIKEDGVRDMRRGLICFVAGTLVDTPIGQVPIEELQAGQVVRNAVGLGRIRETMTSVAPRLVRVRLSNGGVIDCTPEHPFFTRRGWVKAVDLRTYERVLSAHETMRLLRRSTWPRISEPKALFGRVSRSATSANMRALPKAFSSGETKAVSPAKLGTILLHDLCESMGSAPRLRPIPCNAPLRALWETDEAYPPQPRVLLEGLSRTLNASQVQGVRERFYFDDCFRAEWEDCVLQHVLQMESDEPSRWREKSGSDAAREGVGSPFPDCHIAPRGQDRTEVAEQREAQVLARLGVSGDQAGCRVRRGRSSYASEAEDRCEENRGVGETWVESVTLLEPRGDSRFSESAGGYRVYNLEVEGHPSYSVSGVIVHNCIPCLSASGQYLGLGKFAGVKQKRRRLLGDELQFMTPSYIDAIANLNSGDFKCIACGNPLGTDDPLDKIAEPKRGWSSIPEPTTTVVWDNKFAGGRTINLVGTDSPNFDYPADAPKKYDAIIGHKEINDIEVFYGKNSLQYYSQALGIRKTGLRDNRVLTRELCEKFDAFSDVVWKGTALTRVMGLDVGYLGDRCVAAPAEFGKDINGNVVLNYLPHFVVPVRPDPNELPEDQIAKFMKTECERLGIPPTSLFYDSTGRGGMGGAFARCWSAYVVGVEFGGPPTKRPVANTLLIYDEKLRQRRLKLCSEHFSKFVTELWFMLRYAVESSQIRGLGRETADELCARVWGFVRGDKIEVEPKDETKKRTNRSPDLADAAVLALEGARRLGFQIEKVANAVEDAKDDQWKRDLADRAKRLRRSYTLTHAA